MITKNPKTSDTGCISKKKPPKKPYKSHKITLLPPPQKEIREGGRTVGSDRVADIEAVLVVETTDKERRYLNQDGQDMVKI